MIGYSIRATDGDLGKIREFFFDDISWTIRYMVVETGDWLSGRKVLIALAAMGKPEWQSRTFSVNLTSDQVRNSPDIDTEMPVYRQHEAKLQEHYLWPPYWQDSYGGVFGITPFPPLVTEEVVESTPECKGDLHLRSTRQVKGYYIAATDGEIGHVEDFIVDDENWVLRYLVVATRNWLPGKKVLIAPQWVKRVDWEASSVYVDLSQESIKNSPEYDHSKEVTRDYENNLYDHYGRPIGHQ
jgi:hypothetical protein